MHPLLKGWQELDKQIDGPAGVEVPRELMTFLRQVVNHIKQFEEQVRELEDKRAE